MENRSFFSLLSLLYIILICHDYLLINFLESKTEIHRHDIMLNFYFIPAKVTREEVYYLKIIYLLYRIACPVVRMTFDQEIQPKQLRKTLDRYKLELEKRYRKKDTIINDVQWGLLFGSKKGT